MFVPNGGEWHDGLGTKNGIISFAGGSRSESGFGAGYCGRLSICTDSYAVIRALDDDTFSSRLAAEARAGLQDVAKKNRLCFIFIPPSASWEGGKRVDRFAERGSGLQNSWSLTHRG